MDARLSQNLMQITPMTKPQSGVGWGRPDVDNTADQRSQLRAAAGEFEALFLNQFMKQARETQLAEGLLSSDAEKTFQGMLDTEMTRANAGRMRIGLADAMVRQLGRNLPEGQ